MKAKDAERVAAEGSVATMTNRITSAGYTKNKIQTASKLDFRSLSCCAEQGGKFSK